jgi:transposase
MQRAMVVATIGEFLGGDQAGKSIPRVCRELDLSPSAVRRWAAQAAIDAGEKDGVWSAEREELTRLRRENKLLREGREILKKSRPSSKKL